MPENQRNPRDLLDEVIGLIESDLSHIKKSSKSRALEPDEALTLSRYSKALLDIVKDIDESGEKKKKSLAKLSDQDLAELAEKALREMKGQNAPV